MSRGVRATLRRWRGVAADPRHQALADRAVLHGLHETLARRKLMTPNDPSSAASPQGAVRCNEMFGNPYVRVVLTFGGPSRTAEAF